MCTDKASCMARLLATISPPASRAFAKKSSMSDILACFCWEMREHSPVSSWSLLLFRSRRKSCMLRIRSDLNRFSSMSPVSGRGPPRDWSSSASKVLMRRADRARSSFDVRCTWYTSSSDLLALPLVPMPRSGVRDGPPFAVEGVTENRKTGGDAVSSMSMQRTARIDSFLLALDDIGGSTGEWAAGARAQKGTGSGTGG